MSAPEHFDARDHIGAAASATGGPDVLVDITGSEPIIEIGDVDAVWVHSPRSRYRRPWLGAKRAVDICVAGSALFLLAPVMAVIAVVIRATSPGPALFRQERVGRGAVPFTMLKFRTMAQGADAVVHLDEAISEEYRANDFKLPLDRDPRVTRVGRLLRRTSMDELPQLLNVLRGEMSIVGPRPVLAEELELYGPYRAAYVTAYPGMTGRWQVEGRNRIRYPERARIDGEYVNGWSVTADLKILMRTVPALVSNRDVL